MVQWHVSKIIPEYYRYDKTSFPLKLFLIFYKNINTFYYISKFSTLSLYQQVNKNIIVAAAGEYSDYQFIRDTIEEKVMTEKSLNDGISLKPKALHTWLSRVLYNRRTKMKPLWSTFLVAGIQNGKPFLGEIDKIGTAFADDQIASGYGAYLALPLLRKAIDEKREKSNSSLTKDEAVALLKKCMEVLYYRYFKISFSYSN